MKRIAMLGMVLAGLAMLLSCSTVSDLVSQAAGGAATKAAVAEVADFKTDELLCGNADSMMDAYYYLAKVTKPASAATKNQTEVIYVKDGSKEWVVYVLKSHKVKKAELEVGAVLLYPTGWAEYDTISAEEYRKATWAPGRVTSTDDLFKGLVEVRGEKFYTQLLRAPDEPIEE